MSSGQDETLRSFNQRAQEELNRERQSLANEYLRNEAGGGRLDRFSPAVRAILTQSVVQSSKYVTASQTTSKPIKAGSSTGTPTRIGQRMLRGALFAASGALVVGLSLVVLAEERDRPQAWKNLVGDVCLAATAGGTSVAMVAVIKKSLEARASLLLQAITKLGPAVCSSAAVAGSFTAAYSLIKSLWYALQASMAGMDGDVRTQQEQMAKAKEQFSIDNLCRAVAAAVCTAAISAAPLPVAGFVSVLLPTILYWVGLSLTDHILERKNANGGWLSLVRTWFTQDQRLKQWSGTLFDDQETYITRELQCNISHNIV
ncbi:hypothetical protein B0A48_06043 [Cryoendolithus antarcticus]|uniref:Uncharacterized protein n=1 Tax=Cryoendolithus antarcticus TaxID=1507870 RepID=A0A1V8TD76_9PEZI|nr:hypothetical protein B0A48_06043 [Cryoendolithus antarcticus]